MVYFDAEHHRYTDSSGQRLPSVTQMLAATGMATDYGMVDPVTLEVARQRGTLVHELCARMDRKEPMRWADIEPEIAGYLDGYVAFVREAQPVVICTEEPLAHPTLGYAGTPDLVCQLAGKLTVMDRKCTSSMAAVTAVQCAAYAELVEANYGDTVQQIAGLLLLPSGRYSLHPFELVPARNQWSRVIAQWKENHETCRVVS